MVSQLLYYQTVNMQYINFFSLKTDSYSSHQHFVFYSENVFNHFNQWKKTLRDGDVGGEQKFVLWTSGSGVVISVSEVFGKLDLRADYLLRQNNSYEFVFLKSTGKRSMITENCSCEFFCKASCFSISINSLHSASLPAVSPCCRVV